MRQLGSKRAPIIWLCAAVVVSMAAVIAPLIFGGESYYLSSVVIVTCALVPFFVSFEARRPQAHEVVMLAVMCALAIASRAVFAWVPHFKPTAALVMISGMALGAQPGFLVGAITMLASNFMFGQGYWTPWQMLAFGLAGLVFGIFADKGVVKRSGMSKGRLAAIAVAGGLFVLLVLGPLLDTSSLVMFMGHITGEGAAAIYLAGAPINAIHATATAVTLFLLTNPILRKVTRVNAKYGMYAEGD